MLETDSEVLEEVGGSRGDPEEDGEKILKVQVEYLQILKKKTAASIGCISDCSVPRKYAGPRLIFGDSFIYVGELKETFTVHALYIH